MILVSFEFDAYFINRKKNVEPIYWDIEGYNTILHIEQIFTAYAMKLLLLSSIILSQF